MVVGGGGGVYDKHPLELGGYSKSALHGGYGYFLELHKVVYLGIYSVFFIKWLFLVFSHRRYIKAC